MTRKNLQVLAGLGALLLAGCGQGQQDSAAQGDALTQPAGPAGESPAAGPVARGPAAPASFIQCASCHAVTPGRHGIGPSLAGVYGTRAGAVAGYNASDALKASGLTWDEATLDAWLAGPLKLVPGTRMTYPGMGDPAQRAEIIAYLKALK